MTIPVLATSELLRLLGMAVASSPSSTVISMRTMQQIRATLHLSAVKTTNLLQRIALCQAVIMPKLLFVGRHAWPNSKTFDELQQFVHQYAWHATLAGGAKGRRAWMSADVAYLPVKDGGLGLPDVRAAFLKMSTTTVARWKAATTPVAAAAGGVLLRLCSGGPASRTTGASRSPLDAPRMASSLATSGHTALRTASSIPRTPAALASLLSATGRGRLVEKSWHDGWLHCKYEHRDPALTRLRDTQRDLYGEFNHAALLAAPVASDDVLRYQGNDAVKRADFPDLLLAHDTIGKIIQIGWMGPRHIRFRCRRLAWPMSPRVVEQFGGSATFSCSTTLICFFPTMASMNCSRVLRRRQSGACEGVLAPMC